jgi:hypothetical protein
MTVDEYYAAIRRLGLRPSRVPNVYFTAFMDDTYHVRDPTDMTPEQRAEFIEKLKGLMGITTEA